jgi:ABC-type lipoprotein export system ATPase subunit
MLILLPATLSYIYTASIVLLFMLHDDQNALFTLAADFIHYTNRSVFLTGRAGTGKTTFLKYIKANTNKQTAGGCANRCGGH